jgi:acetyltransferase
MGPNGIGILDTHLPLNTTFVKGMPPKGGIALVSQSGAVCGAVIDWTIGKGIGFSTFVSLGNEADVNETDVIWYLASDDRTRVIALYLEDVKGGPEFVRALAAASQRKPVIAIKTGRTAAGQKATASHTGALASEHAAFRAACRQAGVIEVDNIAGLFQGALALADQPMLSGRRIGLVTNSGGPAALAADTLEKFGLDLAHTSPETVESLRSRLHPDAQLSGPVDMLGGADESGYELTLKAMLADPAVDGVMAIMVPQALINPEAVAQAIAAAAGQSDRRKPVLACLMGDASLGAANRAARAGHIPAFTFPEEAVGAFGALLARSGALARLERRSDARLVDETGRSSVARQLESARKARRTALDAGESRAVLAAYGIPTPRDYLATTPEEAADYARRIGYPVALKLASPDILHKSDAGGVLLDIRDDNAAMAGYRQIVASARAISPKAVIRGVQVQPMITDGQETIIGVKRDSTFGPLVMFGMGGIYVEALADVSFRLAPLSLPDAWEMIEEVRVAKLLTGLRGRAAPDRAALADAIVRVGQLAVDHPEISELDINPMLVLRSGSGASAVDARIILG